MKRLVCLDGLRGIAILLVVGGHAWGAYGNNRGALRYLAPIFANSGLGVRMFFVLSGYLITTLLLEEHESTGRISLKFFYLRRALRIFPAFYTYLGLILVLSLSGLVPVSASQFVSAATYTLNYLTLWYKSGGPTGAWFLGHIWTLSLEEQFYLLWPATLLLVGARRALIIALSMAALMPIIRVICYFQFPDQRGQLGMMFHTASDSIMIGCALALALCFIPLKTVACCLNHSSLLWFVLGFVFIISPYLGSRFRGGYSITLGFTLDAVGVAFLICHVTLRAPEQWLAQCLSFPSLVLVGRLSYSWYLWQQLFLTHFNQTWTGAFPASILCSFAVAAGSHYLIERPFLKLKSRLSIQSRRATSVIKPVKITT